MADFDPYHEWLGISPEDRPINHYSLLSLRCFESNSKVIANAADRQMAFVRTFQTGPYAEESQRILNELSQARVTLLNPKKKKEYDAQLRQEQSARQVSLPPLVPPLKRPEPSVLSQPKRPEPVVLSAPKRPEPEVQSVAKRPEPPICALDENSEVVRENEPNPPDSEDECQQILQVFNQEKLLESMIEEIQTNREDFQFQWFGLMLVWSQLFPSEKYNKSLQKMQRDLLQAKKLHEQCFLNISYSFTPSEREKWDFLKNRIENQRSDAGLPVWKIIAEFPSDLYQAENTRYNVSNFRLRSNSISVGHLDVLHSSEPYIFLGKETNVSLYIYPSFVIITNQDEWEILSHHDLKTSISRVYLVSDRVPQNVKVIDSVWKQDKLDGERDFRHTNDEKLYILEHFKLEIFTKSGRKLTFLFDREDVVESLAAILDQQAKMTLIPSESQDALNDLEKQLDSSIAQKLQKQGPEDGCCGCLLVIIILVLFYVFMGH
ncbi:MAG: hypothetical protein IJQ31_11895 [Thermoguttaceae bacterium]|nr:hypothetical protein [Thermoguttaceae bacterium]